MEQKRYWFKAKKSGLGWSLPLTWQGWLVYAAVFGTIVYFLVFGRDVGEKVLGTWIPILVALPICWIFGEPLGGAKRGDR